MNIGQLHQYLGELIAAGVDTKLPAILPGVSNEDSPQELTGAMLINGPYHGDPAPKLGMSRSRSGAGLLLSGQCFDIDDLRESHNPEWPPVDVPTRGRHDE